MKLCDRVPDDAPRRLALAVVAYLLGAEALPLALVLMVRTALLDCRCREAWAAEGYGTMARALVCWHVRRVDAELGRLAARAPWTWVIELLVRAARDSTLDLVRERAFDLVRHWLGASGLAVMLGGLDATDARARELVAEIERGVARATEAAPC